jgi:putative phosphoesterase
MRIAVISDIHGNCIALDAVLGDSKSESFDQVICLGDAIQGGPQPAETVRRLRGLGCPVVMGNADAWLLTGKDDESAEPITEAQLKARDWSLSRLSEEDRRFIESFRPMVEVALDGQRKLLCFHGSPASFNELIFPETPEEDFQRMLGKYTGSLMCGGHTHLQQIRRIGEYFFFNPGSVGLAYNRNQLEETFGIDPWAEYAVLVSDGDRLSLDLRRVPYNVNQLIDIYMSSGRPHAETIVAQYSRGAERVIGVGD